MDDWYTACLGGSALFTPLPTCTHSRGQVSVSRPRPHARAAFVHWLLFALCMWSEVSLCPEAKGCKLLALLPTRPLSLSLLKPSLHTELVHVHLTLPLCPGCSLPACPACEIPPRLEGKGCQLCIHLPTRPLSLSLTRPNIHTCPSCTACVPLPLFFFRCGARSPLVLKPRGVSTSYPCRHTHSPCRSKTLSLQSGQNATFATCPVAPAALCPPGVARDLPSPRGQGRQARARVAQGQHPTLRRASQVEQLPLILPVLDRGLAHPRGMPRTV